jgi:dUTP pyrophosphatase
VTQLGVRILSAEGRAPERAHPGDAGLDLRAAEATVLGPGQRTSVGTGIAIAVPDGHAGLVLPRSGLAAKHGIALVNAPGLIDSGYRGEVRVLLLNTDPGEPFEINIGDRIAQLVIVEVPDISVVETRELGDTERGEGGFGSTGT